MSTFALRPATITPILNPGGCETLTDVPKAWFIAVEMMDAFPRVMLLSDIVGLLEKVLSEFLWPVPGETSRSILVTVPSGPAAGGLRSGAGRGTRTVTSDVQGFKIWVSSSVQPKRVLLKVFHDEPPPTQTCPKAPGAAGRARVGSRHLPTAFWGAGCSAEGQCVPAMSTSSPESPRRAARPLPARAVRQHRLRMAGFFLRGRVEHPLRAALSSLSLSHRVICSTRSD